jgi:uncharacterized protein (DUF488 family)
MRVYTIGFTKKSAERFFGAICSNRVERVVDVRLNNTSQLAGFSKATDLEFFLREICDVDYVQVPDLAPSRELRQAYMTGGRGWQGYERGFLELMRWRRVEETTPRKLIDGACLLCSEDKPEHCHRRLLAEYLSNCWGDLEIVHL